MMTLKQRKKAVGLLVTEEERNINDDDDEKKPLSIIINLFVSLGIIILLVLAMNNKNTIINTTGNSMKTTTKTTNNNNKVTDNATTATTKTITTSATEASSETTTTKTRVSVTPLFAKTPGKWVPTNTTSDPALFKSDYVWIPKNTTNNNYHFVHTADASTSVVTTDTASFGSLSNYEVVCWIGDDAADIARKVFLELRPQIAKNQRPFKFHYNRFTDIIGDPESSIGEIKRTNRKCKQSWIMLDDKAVDNLSQSDYREAVKHFLLELQSCMHDDTWSIWMMTYNGNSTTACHTPTIDNNNHHPCNAALFDLFEKEFVLGSNIRLADNTDLLTESVVKNKDIVATIAIRIFALISDQVKIWRKAGQIGKVTGLHRGKNVEPDPADECHFTKPKI